MDKLQFLDLSDLNPAEEEQLNSLLYNDDYPGAVQLPPEGPPAWDMPYLVAEHQIDVNAVAQHQMDMTVAQHQMDVTVAQHQMDVTVAQHQMDVTVARHQCDVAVEQHQCDVNPVHLTEMEQPVDYVPGAHVMVPHTVQFTQMMPPASVYVSNVTANVNVHGFMPPQFPPAYMSAVDASRKPRPPKTPAKQPPPDTPPGGYNSAFSQFTPAALPYPYMPVYTLPMQQTFPASAKFVSVNPNVYPYPGFPPHQVFSPHHVPQTEPQEEESVIPYPPEPEQKVEEEEPPVVDTVIVENNSLQHHIEEIIPVVEIQVEEMKLEKPVVVKAPPANAFKSAPSLSQKPPFPPPKQKRPSVGDGPEFVEPPTETGPPKKSYASLFGSGGRVAPQMVLSDPAAAKPLAMIHPTVHNNGTQPANEEVPMLQYSNSLKVRPEKIALQDYDINQQRLGEFLSTYQLDHKPVLLQPRGLTNRSNYCYINAILQALLACPPFYNLLKALPPTHSRSPITDSMVKFVNEFSAMSLNTRLGRREKAQATKDGNVSSNEVVTGPAFEPVYVYKMLGAMQAAFPVEGRQEDAEEFLSCLLNGLNDEMLEAMKLVEPQTNGLTNGDATTNGVATTNGDHDVPEQDHEWTEVINKNNKSVVTRRAEFGRTPLSAIFRGQMRSRVFRAGVENGTTDNVQPFFTLQLDVEKASSVEKALELLVGRDEVVGGICPKTNQEISMFTQTSLEELPIILLLHLKCFDYKLHTCSKIIKTVEFPVDLKIDHKLLTCKSKTSTRDRQYKLLAVVYHDGKEATKGHYLTDVFHLGYSGWVRYDDASVRPVSQQQVLNPRSPRVPYLLYYRRCDTIGLIDKNR